MSKMKLPLALWVIFAFQAHGQDFHTVSIYSRNDLKVLRPCVNSCLYGGGDVAPSAGCTAPHYNQCWCSSGIAPLATNHVSKCIATMCVDTIDVATAVDIYFDYCSGAGYPMSNANAHPVATSVDLELFSLPSRADFKVLRPCVQNCLYGGGDVAPGAGCLSPYYNQCWCSPNIAVSKTKYMSTCVPSLCADNFDVGTAIDIYNDYCSGAGFPLKGVITANPVATSVDLHRASICTPGGDYALLPSCAISCLCGQDAYPGAGCVSPWYDQCWCSAHIATTRTRYLSSCITELCTGGGAIQSAISIYTDYCLSQGFPLFGASPLAPASTMIQVTSSYRPSATAQATKITSCYYCGSGAPGPIATSAPFPTNVDSGPSTTDSPSPSQASHLSAGQIVGIVFAIAAVLAGLMTLCCCLRRYSNRQMLSRPQYQVSQLVPPLTTPITPAPVVPLVVHPLAHPNPTQPGLHPHVRPALVPPDTSPPKYTARAPPVPLNPRYQTAI